jgi:Ran GTPase-activating protein (RanGAP) involved in mRNA processing and transport
MRLKAPPPKELLEAVDRLKKNDRSVRSFSSLVYTHTHTLSLTHTLTLTLSPSLQLTELNLGGRALTTYGFELLGEALSGNTALQHLLIYDTAICDKGL